MASQAEHVKLAQSLPPRLLRFFARYPPPQISSMSHVQTHHEKHSIIPNETAPQSLPVSSANYNPFKPFKDSITGKWRDPVYSLRRQADLVKMARTHNIEGLLPFTTKGTDERIRKRDEQGLRVKGTGVGERVKGKEWERTMKGRLNRRKQAMLQMPKMIQTWKQLGHGRGWKKFPK